MLPFPYEQAREPDNEALAASLAAIVKRRNAPPNSRYDFTRVDLDGDGRRDALVYLKQPYNYWCGQHGCTMYVMRAGLESFEFVSQVQPLRPPLVVSENKTNGWRDLIVHVDGRWSKTKDVALQFNGRSYPADPEAVPAVRRYAALEGTKVFK